MTHGQVKRISDDLGQVATAPEARSVWELRYEREPDQINLYDELVQ
ncbi:hypothetical protein [Saccharothrix sp. ST-888]|nr:hypothetical protein [Saccharothrix sp. ST-888]